MGIFHKQDVFLIYKWVYFININMPVMQTRTHGSPKYLNLRKNKKKVHKEPDKSTFITNNLATYPEELIKLQTKPVRVYKIYTTQ